MTGPLTTVEPRPARLPGRWRGVAACWVGGAARVLDVLLAFHPRRNPAQQVRLGQIRTCQHDVDAALGRLGEAGPSTG